jgi:hypothetical protein
MSQRDDETLQRPSFDVNKRMVKYFSGTGNRYAALVFFYYDEHETYVTLSLQRTLDEGV